MVFLSRFFVMRSPAQLFYSINTFKPTLIYEKETLPISCAFMHGRSPALFFTKHHQYHHLDHFKQHLSPFQQRFLHADH
jgi:hypothetical protein